MHANTHLKTEQKENRERPYNVRFLCLEDERGKIKQAAGRDTGNVIPPRTHVHARMHGNTFAVKGAANEMCRST